MADPVAPTPEPVPTPAPEPAPAPAAEPKPAEPATEAPKSALNQVDPKAEPKAEPAAPVDVAAFVKDLKLPEGVKSDDPSLSKFAEIVSNDKLSAKDRAEALLTLQSELTKGSSESLTKQWQDTQTEWQKQVKADPEIGGDKLQSTLQTISKALDQTLGLELGKSFRQVMDFTGAGNHPAVVKALAKFAEHTAEPGHVPGDPSKGKLSTAAVFFPNSPEFNEPQKGNG